MVRQTEAENLGQHECLKYKNIYFCSLLLAAYDISHNILTYALKNLLNY